MNPCIDQDYEDEFDVSLIIPTKNEILTITQFCDEIFEIFSKNKIRGELILLDRSTDQTPNIATRLGARIIQIDEDGLGNAYRSARGKFNAKKVIIGDADLTYDFSIIPELIELLNNYDFINCSRFKKESVIEKGSMPPLHKYFGTPITTFILSKFSEIPISDAHCGLRAMSAKVYNNLPFVEGGWEYSTEMLIEAHRISENFVEIPTNFRKSLPMRRSHLKISKIPYLLPIRAGLGSIRVSVTRGKKSIMHYFIFPYLFFSYLFLTRTGPTNLEVFSLLSWFSVGILLIHAVLNSYINSVFNTYELSKFISLRRIFRFNASLIIILLFNFLLFISIILSVFFKDLITPILVILSFCVTAIFYFLNVINYEIKLNYLKRVSAHEK